MISRRKIPIIILSIAVLVIIAVFFVVRYRFVRLERIEVVDSEVRAFLENAVDSLNVCSSGVRNTSLFVTTTENSICFDEDFASVLDITGETVGYIKVKGTTVFLDRMQLGSDIPEVFSRTKKQTVFRVLSVNGYNHDLNRFNREQEAFFETKVKGYYKFIDGRWNESTWTETIGEIIEKEREQWWKEHPDSLDFKSAIPPSFVEKYDSLTDKNFNSFLKDWEEWSAQMNALSQDSLLNAILTKVYTEYSAEKMLAPFYLFPIILKSGNTRETQRIILQTRKMRGKVMRMIIGII